MRPVATLGKTLAGANEGNDVASDNDMKAHEQTYDLVMSMLKWGTVASALVGALVIVLIAN